jgi:hypothetical protein
MTMEEATFDIETQAAAAITNIGGDQTVYAGERRSPVPRLVSVLGLLLSLSGLGLLVLTGIRTAETLLALNFWPPSPLYYTAALPDTWKPAVILLVVGIVLSKVGRVIGRQ